MSPSARSSRQFLVCKLLLVAFVALSVTTTCRAQDKVELYGGYSYFRASIVEQPFSGATSLATISEKTNLNGWEFSGQYKFLPFLGGVADFNGTYGTLRGAGTREHTFLFGPQISLPAKVSPFAHALFGVAKESQDTLFNNCPGGIPNCTGVNSLGSGTSFASAFGGGIDIKTISFVSIRLIQVDYVRTQLHGGAQNQPRVSAGVVIHF
jgi:hypothetical protein